MILDIRVCTDPDLLVVVQIDQFPTSFQLIKNKSNYCEISTDVNIVISFLINVMRRFAPGNKYSYN
jgi:hypothetical protein